MTVRLFRGIGELAPRYDGFLLDLWGVVHDGVTPYPGALACMRGLMEAGKRVVLLSNAPRRSQDVARRIAAIGVPEELYHAVMSSGEEAWQHLCRRDEAFYAALGRHCLHIGSERDMEMRDGLDLDFVEGPEGADFILNTGPADWDDRLEDYQPLLRQARDCELPMICANPDLVVMHGGRPTLCAGALAQYYEELGGRVRWHGKPYVSVYESCLDLLGIADKSRILAVGDSLRTDIAGANGVGLDSLLIAGGIHAEEFGGGVNQALDLERVTAAIAKSGYSPIGVARALTW
ncbi:MAG: TIGR01459 family HAD-type hydrolase [Alphaproteobacteria bacterium]|nr:TIGR01459 family HAD-type hydrolase [Alphaproteobacteria bacterium]